MIEQIIGEAVGLDPCYSEGLSELVKNHSVPFQSFYDQAISWVKEPWEGVANKQYRSDKVLQELTKIDGASHSEED